MPCVVPNPGLGLVTRVWLMHSASEGVPVGVAGAAHPPRERQPLSLHPEGELFLSSEDSLNAMKAVSYWHMPVASPFISQAAAGGTAASPVFPKSSQMEDTLFSLYYGFSHVGASVVRLIPSSMVVQPALNMSFRGWSPKH